MITTAGVPIVLVAVAMTTVVRLASIVAFFDNDDAGQDCDVPVNADFIATPIFTNASPLLLQQRTCWKAHQKQDAKPCSPRSLPLQHDMFQSHVRPFC